MKYRLGEIVCRLFGHRRDMRDHLYAEGVAFRRVWCSRCGITQDVQEQHVRFPLPGAKA